MNGDSITTQPAVYWLNNPFDLNDVTKYPVNQTMTIRQWLVDNGGEARLNRLPTVCVYDGQELLRADYDQVIDKPVCFVTLPTGGDSGTNPLAAIAMIAMSVMVPGMVLGWEGVFINAAKTGLSFTGAMTSGVLMMGGAMLINAVFPPPGLPNSATPSTGSPTYSMSAQGNAARLGAPIPVNYGRMRIYPDFAAQPYSEYEANEQYLYQLFCIGQGENRISDIRLEDTSIEHFSEVTTEIIPPLGKVTLFHTAVVTAVEAGGQEMSEPITLGPYIVNAVETEISRIAVDVVFPGGLMGVDEDNGDEYSVGVHLTITAELVDDNGDPSGGSTTIFNSSISDCTRTAIRRTLAADIAPGRYRVTVSRTTDKGPNHEVRNCSLGSIKGYLVDDNEYGDITLLAMRVRASANLSDSASRMVNVLNERLIPVWSPAGWSEPQLTRNPAWAFADAVRARYGGDFADSELDLEGLQYLATVFQARGDQFDGRFDTGQSLWEGLGKIGQVCRSGPVRQGNVIRLIRDQHIEVPSQVFGMANMTDFSVDYVMHDDRTADAVKVTYWDETRDYAETTITCQLPDDTADNPQEVTLFGCTRYEQAWREGMYLAASNRERRQMVSWTTGLEGHIPTFGDLVIINHDLMGAGQQFGGVVVAVAGAVLTLSSDVTLDGEHWYMILRDRYGEPSAPLPIEAAAPNRVRVLDTLPYIEEDTSREPTHYLIGQGAKVSWPVKITAISPEADNRITIAGCIESEFVHTVDQGVLPPPPPVVKPPPPGLVINNLLATQGGTLHAPVIFLSWDIAAGADRYLIEYSTDGRETWQPAGSGQSFINQHEFAAEVGLLTGRVAAVGAIRGEWAEISVNAGGDFDTPGQVQPVLVEPFTGDALKVRWDKQPAAARYIVRVLSRGDEVRALSLDRTLTDYAYHYTDAQQDAAGRTLTIRVAAENGNGMVGEAGEVTATNPPPAAPTGLIVEALIDSFMVRADHCTDTDLREFRVFGTQDAGFVPGIDNLLYAAITPWASLALKGRWYFRCAWADQWGGTDLNYSVEAGGDSGGVDLGPVEDELADLDNKINQEIDKVESALSENHQSIAELDSKIAVNDQAIDDNRLSITGNREHLAALETETAGNLEDVRNNLTGLDNQITTEITQRKTADEALSKKTDVVSADLSTETRNRVAAILAEETARVNEDEALAKNIQQVVSDFSGETADITAALTAEEIARTSADEALGQRITTVSAELSDETADRVAGIKAEETARVTQDEVLARRITTVQAGYQDADQELDAAITSEQEARTNADEALATIIDKTVADYQSEDAQLQGAITTETSARTDADSALASQITAVIADYQSEDAKLQGAVNTETEARSDADAALARQITSLIADYEAEDAKLQGAITSESEARADADGALGRRIDSVITGYEGEDDKLQAGITSEQEARVDADKALATRIDKTVADYQNEDSQLQGAITSEARVRASEDEVLSERIDTIAAIGEFDDSQLIAGVNVIANAQVTADNAQSHWIRTVEAAYQDADNKLSGLVQTEIATLAEADKALAGRIDTVQAVANDNKAAVQVNASAIASVEGGVEKLETSWGVTLDVNGYVSGFAMNNDGDSSEALFRADTFAVGSPGVKELSFVIKDGAVMMPGVSIQNGSIVAGKLAANSVTAGNVAADAITGREISSATTVVAGTGNTSATLNGVDATWRLYAGHATPASAPFRVDKAGKVYATNADIRGKVTATSGTFTGTITGSTINGGTINGTTGSFSGEIFANKIRGDVVSFAACTVPNKNYGEGITSNTWYTLATVNIKEKATWETQISFDSFGVYQSNCYFEVRLLQGDGRQLWHRAFNFGDTRTTLVQPAGIVSANQTVIRLQLKRTTTTGHNVLEFPSGTIRAFIGKSINLTITPTKAAF